jgi:hypothetical protein
MMTQQRWTGRQRCGLAFVCVESLCSGSAGIRARQNQVNPAVVTADWEGIGVKASAGDDRKGLK